MTAPALPGLERVELLGRGGMGEVYRAWDPALRRDVAVKLIRPDADPSPDADERFRREAVALAGTRHPNVVAVYGCGECDGRRFLVMEYLPGGPLHRAAAAAFPTYRAKARLVEALARGAHAAHEAGVVHRDIKPANVLLAADGTPKLADFGLAKSLADPAPATTAGRVLGTPGYMAPEQADGVSRGIDRRADVFALGVLLYESLTGRRPFQAESDAGSVLLLLTADPVAPRALQPDLPRDLETVCLKCLEKRPGRRYPTAADLADDLGRFAAGEPVLARPPSPARRAGRWAARHPVVAVAALLAGLAVAGFLAQQWYYARQLDRQLDAALAVADTLAEDLVTTVKPVAGTRSTEVRRVLARAEQAFHDLAQGRPTPKVERRLAKLQLGLADINLELGESRSARERADDAMARYQKLLDQSPADPELRLGLARATFLAGRVRVESDGLPQAPDLLGRAEGLFVSLIADRPDDPDLLAEKLDAVGWRAEALRRLDRTAEADAAEAPLTDARRALAERPDAKAEWLFAYGKRLEKQGDQLFVRAEAAAEPDRAAVAEVRGHYAEASRLYQAALDREGWNTRFQERLVEARLSDAETWDLLGELAEFGRRVRAIEPRARAFHEANPENRRLLRNYVRCRHDLAAALRGSDAPEVLRERRQVYAELLAIDRREADRDPNATNWRKSQANAAFAVGLMSEKLGDWPAAAEGYAEAVAVNEGLLDRLPGVAERWQEHRKYILALELAYRALKGDARAVEVRRHAAEVARRHQKADLAAEFDPTGGRVR